ncbi:MAG: DUF917 domain-containing protein [Thermomicrobiales bacterium]
MWDVDEAALERLAIGAGILGTGGGGNPYLGKLHALQLVRAGLRVQVASLDELPDDALVTSVGGMGAPVIGIERLKRGDEALNAMRALERHIGSAFSHVIPGEIGGANAISPMIVAAQSGLPIVDGDGMGRAFPELQMDTFSIDGIPAAPGAICDVRGHVAIFDGFADPVVLERYARAVTIEMGGSAGYAFPVMSGADVKRTAIPDTISLAISAGDAVLTARQHHDDPVDAVLAVTGGQRLFTGKIVDVDRRLSGGFARGVLSLDGAGSDQGRSLTIDLQNEYLIARTGDGNVLAVVPDLICLVDADTADPITTEVVRYGLRVVVLGIPAPEQLKSSKALAVLGPTAFGYDVEYVPLPGVYGNAARVA